MISCEAKAFKATLVYIAGSRASNMEVPVGKLSSAWHSQAGWNFWSLTWSDLFFTYLNTAKPPSFTMTITITKLKAWLHWNCFANYISFAKCLRVLPQGWALLTENQCLEYGGFLPGLLYRIAKINRLLNNTHSNLRVNSSTDEKSLFNTAVYKTSCPLQVKAT